MEFVVSQRSGGGGPGIEVRFLYQFYFLFFLINIVMIKNRRLTIRAERNEKSD